MADVRLQPLPPREALAFWQARIPLTREAFDLLDDESRSLAFTAANLSNLNDVRRLQKAMETAMEKGMGFRDFQKAAAALSIFDENTTRHQMETVFRNNVQTAFNVGRDKRLRQVTDAYPYWMYDAVNDSRVRPSHSMMDGRIYRYDHPFWNTWSPPNGHNCRCKKIPISQEEVDQDALPVETWDPTGSVDGDGKVIAPDAGWRHDPAKVAWRPELTNVRADLRQAFLSRLAMAACGDGASFAAGPSCPALKKRLQQTDLDDLELLMQSGAIQASKSWDQWVDDVAQTLRRKGEIYPVGNIPPHVLSQLPSQPQLALVMMDDEALTHLLRPGKAGRGAGVTVAEIKRLPSQLTQGDWYQDIEDPALLVTWLRAGSQIIKFVVRLDRRVGKGKCNLITTAGMVQAGNLRQANKYRKL